MRGTGTALRRRSREWREGSDLGRLRTPRRFSYRKTAEGSWARSERTRLAIALGRIREFGRNGEGSVDSDGVIRISLPQLRYAHWHTCNWPPVARERERERERARDEDDEEGKEFSSLEYS